jgi:hypothetical protein
MDSFVTGRMQIKRQVAWKVVESPKGESMQVDGLVADSPSAAQLNLIINTFYLVQINH